MRNMIMLSALGLSLALGGSALADDRSGDRRGDETRAASRSHERSWRAQSAVTTVSGAHPTTSGMKHAVRPMMTRRALMARRRAVMASTRTSGTLTAVPKTIASHTGFWPHVSPDVRPKPFSALGFRV